MVRLDRNTRYQITSALKTSALRNLEKVESYGVWDLTFEETEDNKISSRLCLLLAIALDLSLDGLFTNGNPNLILNLLLQQ